MNRLKEAVLLTTALSLAACGSGSADKLDADTCRSLDAIEAELDLPVDLQALQQAGQELGNLVTRQAASRGEDPGSDSAMAPAMAAMIAGETGDQQAIANARNEVTEALKGC